MGVVRLLRGDGDETRAITSVPWIAWVNGDDQQWGANTSAGERVDRDTALTLAAIYGCLRIRSELFGAMPVDVYRMGKDDVRTPVDTPGWLQQPNALMDWPDFIVAASWDMDTDGNVFFVVNRNGDGSISELWLIDPQTVTLERQGRTAPPLVRIDGVEFPGKYGQDLIHRTYHRRSGDVRGLNPIDHARETIGTGIAASKYGSEFFANGAVPPVVIKTPGNPNPTESKDLRRNWFRQHGRAGRRHTPGLITGGADVVQLGFSPEQAQATDTKRITAIEACAYYGIPPEFVGVGVEGSGSLVYSNLEGAWVALIRRALMHPMRVWERCFSNLLPGGVESGQRMRFRPEVFLKPDSAARAAFYKTLVDAKVLLPNEARSFEDWAPIPGGSKFAAPPAPPAAPTGVVQHAGQQPVPPHAPPPNQQSPAPAPSSSNGQG